MQRARGRIVLDIHPSPFLPPFGIKISNETKPSSLPPPSLLLFFLVSPDVMLLRHEPKDRDNGTEIERERERERSHRYPFLPPVMYQACPLAQPFGWETRDTLFSRGWVGFGIMNEIPPRWRVGSVGVADPPRTPPFSLHLHRSVETRNNNTESHVGRPRAFFLRGRHGARARGNVFLLFFVARVW